MIFWRLAIRNIRRNAWRSGLTAAGIAISVALLVWMHAYIDGMIGEMISGATAVDVGQVQVRRDDWADKPKIDRAFQPQDEWLEQLDETNGVKGVISRLEFWGLLGTEKHSEVTRYIGVEPAAMARHTRIEEGIVAGEWLPETTERERADKTNKNEESDSAQEGGGVIPSPVVVGAGLAQRIDVDVGDEVVVFAEASDGSLGNDLLKVHGIVETGKTSIDRRGAFLTMAEAQFVSALPGRIHVVQVMTEDVQRAGEVAKNIGEFVPESVETPTGSARLGVASWRDANPQLSDMIEMTSVSISFIYLIVYLLAGLGIVNTQRMSALERRREFGVMQAIGMTPQLLFGVVMVETVLLSLFGAFAGALLGGGISWYHATYGLSMSTFSSLEQFSYMGVTFSEKIYFTLTPGAVLWPVGVLAAVGIVCGLWPASWASGLNPAKVISGRD